MLECDRRRDVPVRICVDCGAWLSLGTANDIGVAAEIGDEEIRAAMTTSVINDDELTGLVLGCRSEG